MSESAKTKEETRRALVRAIEEHFAAIRAEEENPEDQQPGLLMSWVLFVELLNPSRGPNGQDTFDLTYCTSDSSPAQVVGAARIGLKRLEQDISPE